MNAKSFLESASLSKRIAVTIDGATLELNGPLQGFFNRAGKLFKLFISQITRRPQGMNASLKK